MVSFELLVRRNLDMHEHLHHIILEIWQGESIPNNWKDVVITKIYKNMGDKAVCDNSHGFSLLGGVGKVLARLLLEKLVT